MMYFSSIFFLFSVFIIGYLSWIKVFQKKDPDWSLVFFLGTGILGIFSQTLLLFGVYKKVYLILFVSFFLLYFLISERKIISFSSVRNFFSLVRQQIKDSIKRHDLYLITTIAATILILIILNLVPITTGDAINYHFPFIKDFIISNQINQPIAGITQWGLGFMPALADIINSSFLLLTGSGRLDVPLSLFQSAVLLGLLALLYDISKLFIKKQPVRMLTLLLFLAMPNIWFAILSVGMIDLLLCAFILCSFFVSYKWATGEGNSYLYLTAFFLGSAIAIKYTALVIFGYFLIIYLIFVLRKKKTWSFLSSLCSIGIIMIVSSYWYIKNAVILHNPFYPLLGNTDINSQLSKESLLPQTWWLYAFYPILIYAPFLFSDIASRLSVVEFSVAIFATIGSIVVLWQSQNKDKIAIMFVAFAFLYSWPMSIMDGSIRYNLPSLLSFILAFTIVVDRVIDKMPKITENLWVRFAIVIFIPILALNINIYKKRLPMILNFIPRDVYIEKELGKSYSIEEYRAVTEFMKAK